MEPEKLLKFKKESKFKESFIEFYVQNFVL